MHGLFYYLGLEEIVKFSIPLQQRTRFFHNYLVWPVKKIGEVGRHNGGKPV
jgi:hypothetical protein